MAEIQAQIDELYQIYKQTKKIKLPCDIGLDDIEPGDLYFALHGHSRSGKLIKESLKSCYPR